jgi:nicotinate-nucleotide adenylyltransferase
MTDLSRKKINNERIGIFGGSFDPIHYGHLRCAEEVAEALGLSRIIFIPASVSPLKCEAKPVEASLRLKMIELATGPNSIFEYSDIEILRGGSSYTIDTIRGLCEALSISSAQLTLLIGSDAFNDIASWCDYEELLALVDIAVILREGVAIKKPSELLPVEVARNFCYDKENDAYLGTSGQRIYYLSTTPFGVSSTDIRERVKEGLSLRYLLPSVVEEFILKEGLYK